MVDVLTRTQMRAGPDLTPFSNIRSAIRSGVSGLWKLSPTSYGPVTFLASTNISMPMTPHCRAIVQSDNDKCGSEPERRRCCRSQSSDVGVGFL